MILEPPAPWSTLLAETDDPSPLIAPTFEQTLIVAAVSLAIGYGISLWRDRILPWPTLTEFSEQLALNDVVEIPEALSTASTATWLHQPIQNETDRLGNVNQALMFGDAFLEGNRDARDAIQTAIERLRVADLEADKVVALYGAVRHRGVVGLLGAAVSRTAIVVPDLYGAVRRSGASLAANEQNPPPRPVLAYQRVFGEQEGCFGLDFSDELVLIGAGLTNNKIYSDRLEPVLDAMSRLDTNRLIPMFEALLPLLQSQMEFQRIVVEQARPIVQPRSRWAAHVSVSNYGSAPFLLFPNKGWIVVEAKDMKPFAIPTKLVHVQGNGRHSDVLGTHLVESGKTERFMFVTTAVQSEIPRGDRLRALWSSGDARGRVKFHVRGRELPFPLWAKTSWAQFLENDRE